MKIRVNSQTEEALERNDYRDFIEIYIDNELKFYAADGEPEDNNLFRNFSQCSIIIDLMKMAYDAGLRNETLEITHEKKGWD